jgi:hypothetical protein
MDGSLNISFARRKATLRNFDSAGVQEALTAHVNTFIALAGRIRDLTVSLDKKMQS